MGKYLVKRGKGTYDSSNPLAGADLLHIGKKIVVSDSGVANTAAGAFSGVFDVSGGNKYYDDYTSGSALGELSLSATKALGATSTVRISGDSSFSIPTAWNFSGRTVSSDPSKFNELTLLYVQSGDVRVVNRVFDNPNYVPPITPSNNLSSLHLWYDGTDSSSMSLDAGNVATLNDKAGNISLSRAASPGPEFSTDKLVFLEGTTSTYLTTDVKSDVLMPDVDFHGFFVFKSNSNTQQSFFQNKLTSPISAFGIGLRDGNLGVGIIKDGAWYGNKGVAFSDTAAYHKVEFKQVGGVLTALLDDVEMTGAGTVYTSSATGMTMGSTSVSTGSQKAMDFKELFVKSGEMTTQERTDMLTYINDKYGL